MSASAVINVKAHWKDDRRLNLLDKLVMFQWAWEQREGTPPTVIRFKTYARELGVSVNGVKKAVLHLIRLQYLEPVAVQVMPGEKLRGDHPVTPLNKSGGDHPVTPGGSPSDPLRDHPVTPFKEKKKKKEPPAVFSDFEKVGRVARAEILAGRSALVAGAVLKPGSAQWLAILDWLRNGASGSVSPQNTLRQAVRGATSPTYA